ncbi:hypothetical protein DENSPDRAFT_143240 [Dentipellis sp. KUC8613]|nr:hypothetical protein DENSPDRAFT_143240 [Dentipellis sp. KUC8613]
MAVKRKFDADAVEASTRTAKQLRLAVPFPAYQYESDNDVLMSDASEPELMSTEHYHYRLDSSASTASSESSADSSSYPSFNIYPKPFFGPNGVDTDSHTFARYATPPPPPKNVGLFEPKGNFHHGSCTQIPKLRIACSAGTNGQRTMWSHCEQCGAIEMVDPDY